VPEADTLDGALAIIAYEDPKTGLKFYLEIKPQTYAIESERQKAALVGGRIDTEDKSPLEALVREIGEEIEDSKARSILRSHLKGAKPEYIITDYIEGYESRNYVFVIKLNSEEEWKAVSSSGMTHDAGTPAVMPLEKVVNNIDNFAFNHGEIIRKFIGDYLHGRFSTKSSSEPPHYNPISFSLHSAALPSSYPSTPQNPLPSSASAAALYCSALR